jgi:OOP family OmpA-OmpF porin
VRSVLAVVILSVNLTAGFSVYSSAWSQSNNSVQNVIDALKPQPGKSRGSKPVVQPPAGDTTSPPTQATTTPSGTRAMAAAPASRPAPAATHDDAPSLDFNITFASGTAVLTPSAIKVLDTLGKALRSNELASSKFRIEGHTDTVGTPEANRELSARRATAVVDYLEQKYSIGADRLEAVGMGEDSPVVPTGPQVSEQRNRRVHVVNISS